MTKDEAAFVQELQDLEDKYGLMIFNADINSITLGKKGDWRKEMFKQTIDEIERLGEKIGKLQ